MKFLLGVDEAGRGPLAGPVAVGFVMVPSRFDVEKEFPGVRDSKKLSPAKREAIFEQVKKYRKAGKLDFRVRFRGNHFIDEKGITRAVRSAIFSGVRSLAPESNERFTKSFMGNTKVLLDGLLHAPAGYEQETIIGGDDTVPLISLASIVAKVRRDRLMTRLAKRYPKYGFDIHKGYGTALHYKALKKHGPCAVHRKSFLHIANRQK